MRRASWPCYDSAFITTGTTSVARLKSIPMRRLTGSCMKVILRLPQSHQKQLGKELHVHARKYIACYHSRCTLAHMVHATHGNFPCV